MGRRVVILDTSVLCCWLKVPGKDTTGSKGDRWTFERIDTLIKEELVKSSTFVLPLASIIETGNHVAQAPRDRFRLAIRLSEIIADAANATSPWAAFTDQADLWGAERLRSLVKEWPDLAVGGMSIGDATIKDVADYYARAQYDVEIVTGDAGLKAYTPARPISVPRRRMASPGPGS